MSQQAKDNGANNSREDKTKKKNVRRLKTDNLLILVPQVPRIVVVVIVFVVASAI